MRSYSSNELQCTHTARACRLEHIRNNDLTSTVIPEGIDRIGCEAKINSSVTDRTVRYPWGGYQIHLTRGCDAHGVCDTSGCYGNLRRRLHGRHREPNIFFFSRLAAMLRCLGVDDRRDCFGSTVEWDMSSVKNFALAPPTRNNAVLPPLALEKRFATNSLAILCVIIIKSDHD